VYQHPQGHQGQQMTNQTQMGGPQPMPLENSIGLEGQMPIQGGQNSMPGQWGMPNPGQGSMQDMGPSGPSSMANPAWQQGGSMPGQHPGNQMQGQGQMNYQYRTPNWF
jgi:hypothetical protein